MTRCKSNRAPRVNAIIIAVVWTVFLGGCVNLADHPAEAPTIEIVPVESLDWGYLNPARGDQSPRAATLWGDRNADTPTGFLAQFVSGFASPPHSHNVSYRAVVIRGQVHNDDPAAAALWMPAGSFWTQPAGENHVTAARGEINIALVETDGGPYRVLPVEDAYDNGERPVNLRRQNLVWVADSHGLRVSHLWGSLAEGAQRGLFLAFPEGFDGALRTSGSVFRAVVVSGSLVHSGNALAPGSYFSSNGASKHRVRAAQGAPTVIYINTNGDYGLDK